MTIDEYDDWKAKHIYSQIHSFYINYNQNSFPHKIVNKYFILIYRGAPFAKNVNIKICTKSHKTYKIFVAL